MTIRAVDGSLTTEQKEACLENLPIDRLRTLVDSLEVEAVDRRSRAALVSALARAPLSELVRTLRVPELREFCAAVGLNAKGKKDELAQRIIAARGARLPRTTSEQPDRAAAIGTLKSALRRFALDAAAGYRGRDAATRFVKGLLACFGWPDGEPPGAEIPASITIVEHGQRATRDVAVRWDERRILFEVLAPDTALAPAWNDLLRVCLQLTPTSEFVILTNQREVHLYDLGRDRAAPRLTMAIDDIAKHSDALLFLGQEWVPGTTPKIVNVGKVSRDVADLVARVHRSLAAKHPGRESDVVNFTLQCIVTMFAEDIGLLPREHFTSLLYEGARHRDVERRLRELFKLMATADAPPPRTVAYFNGGLFAEPVTFPLDDVELAALTKAAEANWKYVDPHIFGSVFQGIMDDAARHASGAHYTAHEDIMRVVGPTIVQPWQKRIEEATTLGELRELRTRLTSFRVLDPACGSGNFLYVAFRELYALETQLLARMHREFASAREIGWGSGISTLNFYGFDTNGFAVALAKVTLNIAKKIAFEDRRQKVADASAQGVLEVDPSLPLDNLEKNIVCADALFTAWPEVDAIVGNPPILGDRKIRGELGEEYLTRLKRTSGIDGVVDLSCHWFRRAHDRLRQGGRAGLVATSGIRVGKARLATLDYIVGNEGTIVNAVSSVLWPGEAALNVSMVNWIKGELPGPHELIVDGETYKVPRIATHLQLHTDLSQADDIRANKSGTSMGIIFGTNAFQAPAELLDNAVIRRSGVLRPVITGTSLLTGQLSIAPEYVVFLADCGTAGDASRKGGPAFTWLERNLRPHVARVAEQYPGWLDRWWQPLRPLGDFFALLKGKARMITCSNPQARPIYAFVASSFVPTNTMQVFAHDDDYAFGVIQSTAHWLWVIGKGGKVTERKRYTNEVWTTFPWPQEVSEAAVVRIAAAARELRSVRDRLMSANGWSLRDLYRAAEIDGPHPLKDAQQALDDAVAEAYGIPSDQEVTEFLLELNRCLVEDESQGRAVTGPGLPPALDPRDPRWFGGDCIKPPQFTE